MEQAASAGEILLSTETAALLPGRCLGPDKGPGVLLRRAPPGHTEKLPLRPRPAMPYETVAQCLSPTIRAHVLAGGGMSEHRAVTIAFIRFEGTDALIERIGSEATAEALQRLVSVVQAAADERSPPTPPTSTRAGDPDGVRGTLASLADAGSACRSRCGSSIPNSPVYRRHRGRFAGDIDFLSAHGHRDGRCREPAARLMARFWDRYDDG
jgi:hypothetical protein